MSNYDYVVEKFNEIQSELNDDCRNYLTRHLSDTLSGRELFDRLLCKLGNAVICYPDWHPLYEFRGGVNLFRGLDHKINFVNGFVACPYDSKYAENLCEYAEASGFKSYLMDGKLYSERAFPVVVRIDSQVKGITGSRWGLTGLEGLDNREVIRLFLKKTVSDIDSSQACED